ncbi:M36 family metallopeptidase [Baekduia alba]|uniref:M36 family metallopeptidase n=1 Tax=Baekduia alba TaxID=2997333 RepID=UPI0023415972|nr:M36 family metallopeptidase [Baekduia alba]
MLATCALSSALIALAGTPAQAVAPPSTEGRPDFDARAGDVAVVPPATADARAALAKKLGAQGTVATDAITGGVRNVGRADGFLTGPSGADPAAVALGYVRDHAGAYGLDDQDLASLRLAQRSTTGDGVTHLAFRQVDDGIPAYDSALTANVTADGRLVNTAGAPVHDLDAPSTAPPLGPAAARGAAQRDLGVAVDGDPGTVGADAAQTTTFANGDQASLVTLADPDGDHLAWELTVAGAAPYVYELLVDAASGAVLTRHSLTDFVTANAKVLEQHPGDGTLATRTIGPWLSTPVSGLAGPNVHAYPDRVAPDGIGGDAEIATSGGSNFSFTTTGVAPATGRTCPTHFGGVCTWDGASPSTAAANVSPVTTQVFYYTNKFHDWLAQAPIEFTPASDAFQDDDPLKAETDDYSGVNNANMTTKPDGQSPVMQMYLFTTPYPAVNGGDDATVVYHEYAHGLTSRLVGGDGKADGLVARQSQAMGEGWSDWYALDYLTDEGQLVDDPATPGDELIGAYATNDDQTGIRFNAVDCHVQDTGPHCPGTPLAGPGGFTYGDMGRIDAYNSDHPLFEVHADGEIWAETLWDLRERIGAYTARDLITSALRLSPKQPDFLEMRDEILAADTIAGGTHRADIWDVFAQRGMGFSASATSANSTHVTEAFDTPPVAAPGAPSTAAAQLEQDTPLTIPITNPGDAPLTHVRATLAAASGGVTIGQGSADLGTIAGHAQASAPFSLRVAATLGCGAVAATTLTIASDQGTQSFPISLPVGSGTSGAFARTYAPAATITDNAPAAGLASTLEVPAHRRVGALRVTLAATQNWIGDLHAWLTSPSGTTVDLMERPGIDTQHFYSPGHLVAAAPLIFDDSAPNPIQELVTTTTTVSGAWKPNQPLARFAGEDRAGTWTLRITDSGQGDEGKLTSWSLQTADPTCAVTDAPTGLIDDAATFHARIDPGTVAGTTAAFELGTTTTYGARSPATTLTAGGGLQDFTVATGGLAAGTTYHVRAVALRNGAVVATGADRTFVAGSQPGPGTPRDGGDAGGGDGGSSGGGGTDPGSGGGGTGGTGGAGNATPLFKVPKATMKSLTRSVRLDKKGRYTLTFRATPAKAKGIIKALVSKSSAGTTSFTVPSNGRVKITIKATKKLLTALRKSKAHSVKVKATIRIGVTPFTATLTIKPYKKPAQQH